MEIYELKEEDQEESLLQEFFPMDTHLCQNLDRADECGAIDDKRYWQDTGVSTQINSLEFVARTFYDTVNAFRTGPFFFSIIPHFRIDPYFAEIEAFRHDEGPNTPYRWSEAISRAIRHVLNDQGPCGTVGSMYSELIPEVLTKYYAYNYTDLHIIQFTSPHIYQDTEDPRIWGDNFAAWILQQSCIDRGYLEYDISEFVDSEDSGPFFGMGCACDTMQNMRDGRNNYVCAIGYDKNVVAREVGIRVPDFLDLIDDPDDCPKFCESLTGEVTVPKGTRGFSDWQSDNVEQTLHYKFSE